MKSLLSTVRQFEASPLIQVRNRETAFPREFFMSKNSLKISHFLSSSLTTSSANSGGFPYSRLRLFFYEIGSKRLQKAPSFFCKTGPKWTQKDPKGPMLRV